MPDLPYAHGGPPLTARLRASPEDFVVVEELGFEPSGEGEHCLLTVRKRGTNTEWLAGQLAEFAGVAKMAVSYAGLKDRHAVTTQSFTIQLPGREDPDWSRFPHAEVEILGSARHNRKLRRGALASNRFEITLREVSGDRDAAERCLAAISARGVPNYFGEQRFGRDGGNLARAEAMFGGARVRRHERGMLISAARSQIFNAVLAERVDAGHWSQILPGEVLSLAGSRSWFVADAEDSSLEERLASGDIHPSGPLWGQGELPSRGEVAALEQRVAAEYPRLTEGLVNARLDQERRALRLCPQDLAWEWLGSDTLQCCFSLPAGAYATVVLRELAANV